MTQDVLTEHREYLLNLAPFCEALLKALQAAGLAPDKALAALRDALTAECVQCGIRVSGEELSALAQPPSAEHSSAKTGRMRMGECARQGCNSCYYRLTFHPHAKVDWPRLLAQVAVVRPPPVKAPSAPSLWNLVGGLGALRRVPLRAWLGLGAVLLLLLLRQWHLGGRIPLLREPEHFKVVPREDPVPDNFRHAHTD